MRLNRKIKYTKTFGNNKNNYYICIMIIDKSIKSTLEAICGRELVNEDVIRFGLVCMNAIKLYARKNKDYGNSFDKGVDVIGPAYAVGRLYDKMNRIISISNAKTIEVKDEKLEDTLMDLANYSIMYLAHNDKKKYPTLEVDDLNTSPTGGSDLDIDKHNRNDYQYHIDGYIVCKQPNKYSLDAIKQTIEHKVHDLFEETSWDYCNVDVTCDKFKPE